MAKGILVRTIMRYLKNISITLIATVMVTLACIQIPNVKSHVIQFILSRISTPHGVSMKVDGVHGVLPFHLNVKTINIADSSGVLADIHDLRINIATRMLLFGKIQIESITLKQLEWYPKKTNDTNKVTNQIPATLTTALPIILDQTVLKRVHIDVLKTPTAQLSFHFQKNDKDSLVELKSIATNIQKMPPIEGTFRLAPKSTGATATLRLIDRIGMINGSPLTIEGSLDTPNMDMLLPVGSVTVNMADQKAVVQLSTANNNTRIHITDDQNDISFDVNIRHMLEKCSTSLQNIVARTKDHHIKGRGNILYDTDRIVLDGEGTYNSSADLTFNATWMLQDKSAHIKGTGHWQTTPFQLSGDLGNIGTNTCLKNAAVTANGHTITVSSPKGLSLNSQNSQTDSFNMIIDGHTFDGTASFSKNAYLLNLKPTWRWTSNHTISIHINTHGAHAEGGFDFDCAKLSGDTVHGIGHGTFHFDHTLSGMLSCTLPSATVAGATFESTAATIQFNKGDGTLTLTTGGADKVQYPHGSAKAKLLLQKQMMHLDSFQLVYQQHNITLKEPITAHLGTENIPNFSLHIGKKGLIHGAGKQIIFKNVPLKTACIFSPSWDMDGLLNGKIDTSSSLDQWKGQFVLSKLIPYLSNPLTNEAPFKDFSWTIHAERQAKQLLIDTYTQRGNVRIFKAKGSMSLDSVPFTTNTVSVDVTGELDLSLLSSLFNTPDRLGGILNLNLNIKGTLANVEMSGRIHARQGLYESADNGTYIANIAGSLKAVGKKLIIEQLTGNDVRNMDEVTNDSHVGTLDITGGFEFVRLALPNFALNLKLNDLIVVHRDDMTMRATGAIKIDGPGLQSKITGAVELSPSLVMLEEFSNDDASYIEIDELDMKKKTAENDKNPVFPIELTLNVSKNFYVRDLDLGLMSQWTGAITVKGDMSAPYLEGTITATKGKLSFFGKSLKVTEAKLMFDREHRNNPNVWLVGKRAVDDVTVCLQVSGYSPSPRISFVSDPALPENEVLSRLLFGKELSKISAGQSVQLASVGASLNNKKGLNFLENLRSSFGFDTFELKENEMKAQAAESGQTASQALSVGKEFENMRISIDQSIGSAGSKATVSTGLGKNVYLDLEVGEKNTGSAAGLSWAFRY